MVECFSECPNTADNTRSGKFLRYKARWTQWVLLPVALVLTHRLEHAKACLEWRRRGSPWVIHTPTPRLLTKQKLSAETRCSLKTCQHCFVGIKILILIAPINLRSKSKRWRVKQRSRGLSRGQRTMNPWAQWILESKSSLCLLGIPFYLTKKPKCF